MSYLVTISLAMVALAAVIGCIKARGNATTIEVMASIAVIAVMASCVSAPEGAEKAKPMVTVKIGIDPT